MPTQFTSPSGDKQPPRPEFHVGTISLPDPVTDLIMSGGLSRCDLAVYLVVRKYATSDVGCVASNETLGKWISANERHVRKAVTRLLEVGLITAERGGKSRTLRPAQAGQKCPASVRTSRAKMPASNPQAGQKCPPTSFDVWPVTFGPDEPHPSDETLENVGLDEEDGHFCPPQSGAQAGHFCPHKEPTQTKKTKTKAVPQGGTAGCEEDNSNSSWRDHPVNQSLDSIPAQAPRRAPLPEVIRTGTEEGGKPPAPTLAGPPRTSDSEGKPPMPPKKGTDAPNSLDKGVNPVSPESGESSPQISDDEYKPDRMVKRLRDAIFKKFSYTPPCNPTAWALEFRKLISHVGEVKVLDVLKWYADHIRDQFVPNVQSAKAFRERFNDLQAAMDRQEQKEDQTQAKETDLTPAEDRLATAVRGQLKRYGLQWRSGLAEEIPGLVRRSAKKALAFRRKLSALDPAKLSPTAVLIRTAYLEADEPDDFWLSVWFAKWYEKLAGWESWGGDTVMLIWRPESKHAFARIVELVRDYHPDDIGVAWREILSATGSGKAVGRGN